MVAQLAAPPALMDQFAVARQTSTCLQLYAASSIMGIGVFTLPFLIPTVGLLPALVVLVVVARVVSPLYQRLTQSVRSHADQEKQAPVLSGSLQGMGGGMAASTLGRLGAVLHALPGMLAYLTISAAAMSMIYNVVEPFRTSTTDLVAVLLVTLNGPLVEARAPIVGTILRLARFWTAALVLVDLVHLTGTIRSAVFVLGATAGILDLGRRRRMPQITPRTLGGLRPEHSSAVAVLIVQLVAMVAIAACAVVVVVRGGGLAMPAIVTTPTPGDLLVALGVILFALKGTGHANLASYQMMRTKTGISTVISGAVRISLLVQAVWLLVAAVTVPMHVLADLDAQKSFSTVGIAQAIERSTPTLGQSVLLVGAVLVMFGLSSSTHSMSESLVLEFFPGESTAVRRAQVASILGAAAVAIGLLSIGVTITQILAVGGFGGGLLVMFVLPILAETNAELRSLRRNQAIGATVLLCGLVAGGAAFDGSAAQLAATVLLGIAVICAITRTTANIVSHDLTLPAAGAL